jgi:glycerol kinase
METKNIRAPFVLAIDQGTSSTKTLIFDINGNVVARGSEPLQTSYLPNGFVEQDPVGIYQNVLASLEHCLADFAQKGYQQSSILSIGISNQRETFVLWDDKGQPLCPAIVWQCKRSVAICGDLQSRGLEPMMQERTGLLG